MTDNTNTAAETVWHQIGRYAQRCPSPHNTQPFRLKIISKNEAEVVFLPRRGLYVGDPHGRFTWLTAGIFIEICSVAAHSLGYELDIRYDFLPMYPNGDFQTPQTIARLTLERTDRPNADLDASLILKRHTSRLPYDGTVVTPEIIQKLQTEAARFGHRFETRTDTQSIKWVVELNKQSLFHDLDNHKIRRELIGWLRFDRREELLTHDGLSARCLIFSGRLLKSFFLQHRIWTLPIIRGVVGRIYKSTMKGIGTIGWLQGKYQTLEDWTVAGKVMIRLWLMLTEAGFYWHPYGSVITNESARQNMIRYLKIEDEQDGANMVWLLLRLGHSAKPPVSERLPLEEIILCG